MSHKHLTNGSWVRQTGHLDDDTINLMTAVFYQLGQDTKEILIDTAAHDTVVQLDDILLGQQLFHEFVIDTNLTEFVFDHHETHIMIFLQDSV